MMFLQKAKCKECGGEWIPRVSAPVKCPRCQSLDWNVEPKEQGGHLRKDQTTQITPVKEDERVVSTGS